MLFILYWDNSLLIGLVHVVICCGSSRFFKLWCLSCLLQFDVRFLSQMLFIWTQRSSCLSTLWTHQHCLVWCKFYCTNKSFGIMFMSEAKKTICKGEYLLFVELYISKHVFAWNMIKDCRDGVLSLLSGYNAIQINVFLWKNWSRLMYKLATSDYIYIHSEYSR